MLRLTQPAGRTQPNASKSASSAAAAFRLVPAAPGEVPVRRAGQHLRHHSRAGGRQAKQFNVAATSYPHIDKMLAGPQFDLLVNLTDMQEHEQLNRAGDRGRQARLEREADGQLARRRAGAAGAGQESAASGCGRARSWSTARSSRSWPRRSPPASSAASPPPTPTTATPGRTGRRSSTRRAAAACPTSASTT